MNTHRVGIVLLTVSLLIATLDASELPRLPKDVDPQKQSYTEQKQLPDQRDASVEPFAPGRLTLVSSG